MNLNDNYLAAYLMKHENLSAEEAIQKIRKLRPGSVEGRGQEQCLEAFQKYLEQL